MKAISMHFSVEEVLKLSINSGVDVLMFSHNIAGTTDESIEEIHQTLVDLVMNGEIEYDLIRRSYNRIMIAKTKLN